MCGRFTIRTSPQRIADLFELAVIPDLKPRYNVAPTQLIPVVRETLERERELAMLRWGLIPFWAKDPAIGSRMINARADSLADKPSFRDAYKRRRCLIVADGFYEWKTIAKKKYPILIHFADDRPFAFAGLWERWNGPEGPVETATIVTTNASPALAGLHERMPVMLAREHHSAWLDASAGQELLVPFQSEELTLTPVSTAVNSARFDGPECCAPAETAPAP